MSQNAMLSLLAALVIGVAVLLIWCVGGIAPGPGRVHRVDQPSVAGAQHDRFDTFQQSASARRQPSHSHGQGGAGRTGPGSTD